MGRFFLGFFTGVFSVLGFGGLRLRRIQPGQRQSQAKQSNAEGVQAARGQPAKGVKKKIHAAVSLIARERAYWGEWAWRDKLKTVNQCQSFKKFNNIVKMLSM